MKPYYSDESVTLYLGDALDVLRGLPVCSVDAVVTDPPYGLEFMGKDWDAPWAETGINTDAGFGGGGISATVRAPSFTSSTNPNCLHCGGKQRGRRDGTAIVAVCICASPRFPNVRAVEMRAYQQWCDAWAVECLRVLKPGGHLLAFGGTRTVHRLTCAIEDAGLEIRDGIDWIYGQGFPKSLNLPGGLGTALKPAREPIVVARKPLSSTVAANVLEYGTGALNIDGCRTNGRERTEYGLAGAQRSRGSTYGKPSLTADFDASKGRWPTNVVLSHAATPDGADLCGDGCVPGCPVAELDAQSGASVSRVGQPRGAAQSGDGWGMTSTGAEYTDAGGASRYFPVFRYEAKAPTAERPRTADGTAHPTVKPLDFMRWLVRLVTPKGGVCLDPFAGSGTTAEACVLEGFRCITVEREAAYLPLIVARLAKPLQPALDFSPEAAR